MLDGSPDVDAFIAGVQMGLGAAFIVIAVLGALSVFRRIVSA